MMKPGRSFNTEEKQESLDVLNYQIRGCKRCDLAVTRLHALPGEGNTDSRIMIVALSPGSKENVANRMFVGPSGQVLERLFQAAGIKREGIFMTNLVKCMLPGNRKPKASEINICGQYLEDEISILQPEVIVPLGQYASRAVMNKFQYNLHGPGTYDKSIVFGELLYMNGQKIYPLSHPAALLYNPSYEAGTMEKYKKLKAFI